MPQAACDFVNYDLVLCRDAPQSLQEQICAFLRRLIVSGRLSRGSRMPSSRRLAAEQGISRTTVVEAYERLEAEGYVVARPRAGFFVADVLPEEFSARVRRPLVAASSSAAAAAPVVRHPGRQSASRPSSADGSDWLLPLAPGMPAVDRFPWELWTKLSAQVLRSRPTRAMAAADPLGEPALRAAVADYLGTFRGIPCSAEQIVVSNGSQPIVQMLAHMLTSPGDDVWFEDPGDPTARAVLETVGLRPVPVRVDGEGLDVDAGRAAAPRARLALVAPSHHYPLGIAMSMTRRRALLDWAAEQGAWVIENEIDGDYRFAREAREPLYTLDTEGRVIFLGSFNKAVAPGLRIGYAVLPKKLHPAASIAPMVGAPQQLMLAEFWASGRLAAHFRLLRQIHARRRSALLAALREEAADVLELGAPPEAELRVAARLAGGIDDDAIVRACLAAGIKLGRPLTQCYAAGGSRRPGLSFGFGATPTQRIAPAVRRMAAVIRRARAAHSG